MSESWVSSHGRFASLRSKVASFRLALSLLLLSSGVPAAADPGPFLSGEFLVNTVTENSENSPSSDSNPAGAAVVVWTCNDGIDPGVCAQRYNSAGVAAGPEIAVNTTTANVQQSPDVAILPDGSFLVVWESLHQDGDNWGVFGRLFDNAGNELGAERRISVATQERQRYPAVAAQPGQGFVVSWDSNHDDLFEQVYFRRFDSKLAPLSGDVLVSSNGPGAEREVAVAADADGNFAIAWKQLSSEVFARRYSSLGVARSSPFSVSGDDSSLGAPSIDMAADGAFAIAWEGLDGDSAAIWARSYSASGTGAAAASQVNQFEIGQQRSPSVAIAGDHRYYVTWQSFAQESPSNFSSYVRSFSASGAPTSDEILVADRALGPVMTLDESGEALVVWQGWGPDVFGRRWQTEAEPCAAGDHALCLSDNRFKVEAAWRKPNGETGSGRTLPLTADTGTFWFFRESNLEAVVKLLDGCGSNQRYWIFAAGLTNLYVDVMVTDTVTGQVEVYNNPQSTDFLPIQDTGSFGGCDQAHDAAFAEATHLRARESTAALRSQETVGDRGLRTLLRSLEGIELAAGAGLEVQPRTGSCIPSSTALCLGQGRFRIDATFATGSGQSGSAHPFPLTDDTGYFWFFRETNVELLIKVLDGCSLNDRFWMFAAGLTNVEVDITITDTETGSSKTYRSPKGNSFDPILDSNALDTCDL